MTNDQRIFADMIWEKLSRKQRSTLIDQLECGSLPIGLPRRTPADLTWAKMPDIIKEKLYKVDWEFCLGVRFDF